MIHRNYPNVKCNFSRIKFIVSDIYRSFGLKSWHQIWILIYYIININIKTNMGRIEIWYKINIRESFNNIYSNRKNYAFGTMCKYILNYKLEP